MTRKFHATETRFRSLFELCSRHPTLPDDRQEFAVVWDGNRDAAGLDAAPHDDMTSPPAHLDEPVLLTDPTDFASRKDAKSSIALRRLEVASSTVAPWLATSSSGHHAAYRSPSFSTTAVYTVVAIRILPAATEMRSAVPIRF
jgi:hypothetical protein